MKNAVLLVGFLVVAWGTSPVCTALKIKADAKPDTEAIDSYALQPNTAGQKIAVWVEGADQVSGLNLFAQIGDGGPELAGYGLPAGTDGPAITGVQIKGIWTDELNQDSKTIFADVPDNQIDLPGIPQVANATLSITAAGGSVLADGVLTVLTIDTTGFSEGQWALLLGGVLPGMGGFNTDFAGVQATIVNGSIEIVPEPASLCALLLGMVLLQHRRRGLCHECCVDHGS